MVNPVNGNDPNKGCQIQSEQLDKSVELTEEHSMEFTSVNAFRAMLRYQLQSVRVKLGIE
ncbi:hypothetical protein T09_1946 [Trichinella sp. T9]|nr:hypothetical protein T09_1946 [Trichinella sp. T9]